MPSDIPLATYRVQLTSRFGFDDAAAIVPYLKALGITHLYSSPVLKARAGSTHGYDVTDPTQLNPELGGEAAFYRLVDALREADIGLIVDFVPNHVGVHYADNPWWLDVLEWGKASPFARYFDIDWQGLPHRRSDGLLVPVLGVPYREALESGQLVLKFDGDTGSFSIWYFEHRLPVAPARYADILKAIVQSGGMASSPLHDKLADLADRFPRTQRPSRNVVTALKAELAALGASAEIETGLDALRAGPERPAQTLALHRLLERQNYRLAHWRLATTDINYRRFFDINSLAGLRVEDEQAFTALHQRIADAIQKENIQGIRLDHIDGLRDPARYCRRLQRLVQTKRPSRGPFYTIIEKILHEGEPLPLLAGVSGTTGYEWLNLISRILTYAPGLGALDRAWSEFGDVDFSKILRGAKQRVLRTILASEFSVLVRMLSRIAAGHYSTRDFSTERLRQALELYTIQFPVYRTYVTAVGPGSHDRALIDQTISAVRDEWFGSDPDLLDFVHSALTLDLVAAERPHHSKARVRDFALKFQQFTGPMMAKSLEDTAFYRYHRLIALNEVGGDPSLGAISPASFHQKLAYRQREQPHGLTATSTHDTKRAEDARTRILALAELATEWSEVVANWREINAGKTAKISRPDEYLLYQALIGAWPLEGATPEFIERFQAFAVKAVREAKTQTSWLNPNDTYEKALFECIASLLDPQKSRAFLESFSCFADRTTLLGALSSLSQTALKIAMPGVPDFYQGTELWDLSLVDPDNRRPVDFDYRGQLLNATTRDWQSLAKDWRSGAIKLAWTHHLLQLRKAHAELFTGGEYMPLDVSGPHRDHVIAFARKLKKKGVVTIAVRHFAPFTDGGRSWFDGRRIDAVVSTAPLNGLPATVAVSDYLGPLPCALIAPK